MAKDYLSKKYFSDESFLEKSENENSEGVILFFDQVFRRHHVMQDPVNWTDPSGLKVIQGKYVVSPKLLQMLEKLNEFYLTKDIVITGGDRYRDGLGNIRSSTDNSIVKNSALYSKHIAHEAVDFSIPGVDESQAAAFAKLVGFDWVKFGYDNPHIHADIGGKGGARLICK